jgi:hypothetical protein
MFCNEKTKKNGGMSRGADGGGVGLGGALGISAQPIDGPSGEDGYAGADAALLARLRLIVPLFAALAKPPNRAELQSALQSLQCHRGGAACLPATYMRKQPAGHEHLIVSNPSRGVLLEARQSWRSRWTAPVRDDDDVFYHHHHAQVHRERRCGECAHGRGDGEADRTCGQRADAAWPAQGPGGRGYG